MANYFSQNLAMKYCCKLCDFNSNNKCDFLRHCKTEKHRSVTNANEANDFSQNLAKDIFECGCGKVYKHKSSLSKHKKKCIIIEKGKEEDKGEEQDKGKEQDKGEMKGLIVKLMTDSSEKMNFLIKENEDLRNQIKQQNEQISELIPKIGNNNNNQIKQKFNINLFLNKMCKDALTMDEFIERIEISMKNLLTTKEKGQTQGISNIIIENMNKLSLYERPLHCTDKKREILYIKNKDWEKDEDKKYINDALKKLESKQLKNIKKWIDKHPNYMNNINEQEEFIKLINETSKSEGDNREKIIKNICNEVYIK